MNSTFSSDKMNDNILNAMYGYYVRYDRLTELINLHFVGSNATILNIFIDVNNILCKVDEYCAKQLIPVSSDLVLMAGLINMAAHYRYFFRSRYNCHTKIWLINAVDNPVSKLYDVSFEYRKSSCKIDNHIMANVCNYIPDVMYSVCNTEFSTMVMYILSKENTNTTPSIVISKDPFTFQLAACINQDIKILRPHKYKSEEMSYIVNNSSVFMDYIKTNTKKVDAKDCLPGIILPVFMAMTRVPSRGIKSLYTIPTALNILNTAVRRDNNLLKYPWDPNHYFTLLANTCSDIAPKIGSYIPALVNRFKAIESVYFLPLCYKEMPESTTYTGMINLYDPKGMQEINEKYFKNMPLDLEVF